MPAAIVFVQPDLGTALVYGAVTLAILFIAGIRWTHFAALGGLAVAAVTVVLVIAPAVGQPVLQGYQLDRLTSFLNPSDEPGDSCYQTNQSIDRGRLRRQDSGAATMRRNRSPASCRRATRTSSSPQRRSDGGSSALRSFYPSTPC